MLVVLRNFGAADTIAGITPSSLLAQARSLAHVDRYAVVAAPAYAAAMIDVFDKALPIDARTFDPEQEDAAWRFVEARPA
jgi:hypothetical protein